MLRWCPIRQPWSQKTLERLGDDRIDTYSEMDISVSASSAVSPWFLKAPSMSLLDSAPGAYRSSMTSRQICKAGQISTLPTDDGNTYAHNDTNTRLVSRRRRDEWDQEGYRHELSKKGIELQND